MKLNLEGIQDRKAWEEKGYNLPEFNITEVHESTRKEPTWIHFGAGNLFKAFHTRLTQELLNQGKMDKGIIADTRQILTVLGICGISGTIGGMAS